MAINSDFYHIQNKKDTSNESYNYIRLLENKTIRGLSLCRITTQFSADTDFFFPYITYI